MGYDISYDGKLTVEPPMTVKQLKQIDNLGEAHHAGTLIPISLYGTRSDWEVNDDGEIVHDGSEKSRQAEDWLKVIVERVLPGHKVNGTIEAEGEDGERWDIIVEDSVITIQDYERVPTTRRTL